MSRFAQTRSLSTTLVSVSALFLIGCETTGVNKIIGAGVGTGLGYGACKLSNANDTECAIMLAAGAVAGYAVAAYIDERDREAYEEASSLVLSGSQTSATRVSSETGNTVTVTKADYVPTPPAPTYTDCTVLKVNYQGEIRDERYCRNNDGKMVAV